MKNNKKLMKKVTPFAILCIAIVGMFSCENDFSDVGSDLVDNNNFSTKLFSNSKINAYSSVIEKIQSNNLTAYNLGYYYDEVYGQATVSVLSQMSLETLNPEFGPEPVIDSVVMTLPYFSRAVSQDENGIIYELDSVYTEEPLDFEIYRSNYLLRDQDPDDNYNAQKYYTNQGVEFENHLEANPITTVTGFIPNNKEVSYYEFDTQGDTTLVTKSPRARIHLPKDYFKQLIFDKEGGAELLSSSNFKNYFRGIYLKPINQEGKITNSLSLLNLKGGEANITIYYRTTDPVDEDDDFRKREFSLNFSGNIINTVETTIPTSFDNNIYLKGLQGSMAVIDIFTDETQLDSIQELNWLVNDANLTFYVNRDVVNVDDDLPNRLFIYDLQNERVLRDYNLDLTLNDNNPNLSRVIHLGKYDEETDAYKVRITNVIADVISNQDSLGLKLGVVVTNNVNIFNPSSLKLQGVDTLNIAPSPSVLTPKGSVFYGVNAIDEKRLKLNIHYTESN
ncbi:DUF4270 domain-containing protein [Mesonia sp. K7]|uniref:DUF4270 domain-containing protein n=1 Tax=Mesonia sp. K7 TaxID=2218606 RepID=UPI000DA94AFE|nr:DUF4270 domain-containing protein [Mesonia sp. K7]PZD78977.1 hypothetical protein DNG35_02945 [Mesonia sp. K7]